MISSTVSPDLRDEDLASGRDFAALYDRYARRLAVYVAGLGVQRADLPDVLQTTWLRAWRALERGGFSGHFRGWLFQIGRRTAIDCWRQRRPTALPDDELTARQATPLESILQQEELRQLQHCLARLEPMKARVFTLRTAGLDYDELCSTLEINRPLAYRLFDHAKRELTDCVQQASS